MSTALVNPFDTAGLAEVPLTHAPLAGVLAQVRFPKETAFAARQTAESVRAALGRYPILREEQTQAVVLGPSGALTSSETLWRLQEKERRWQVTLSPDFVSIDTKAYVSREDFCSRLAEVIEVVSTQVPIVVYDRIGVRYANRLIGEHLEQLDQLLRPELAKLTQVPPHGGGALVHIMTDFQFAFDDGGHVRARWGQLPGNAYLDQSVEPVAEPSWILDIDSAVERSGDFIASEIRSVAEFCAGRAYQFFRWAVKDDFLELYGGRP